MNALNWLLDALCPAFAGCAIVTAWWLAFWLMGAAR